MEKLKPLIVRIPPSLFRVVKHAAVDREVTMREVVTDALRKEFVARERNKEKAE